MDEQLDPELKDDELEDEADDDAILGLVPKKGKVAKEDDEDSLDLLSEEEDVLLPEDKFDDEDLW